MPDFGDVKTFADEHDKQVDAAEDKVGHANQIDKGVDIAQEHTGAGETDNG